MNILMPLHFDQYIYHFTTAEKALLYILPGLKLKLAPYLETNDPKENKTFSFWKILEQCDNLKIPEIKIEFKNFLDNKCKVTCFSSDYILTPRKEKLYIHGYNHPTMWTHYGDNYKGICIVLDKEKFKKENLIDENDIFDFIEYKQSLNFPSMNQENYLKNLDKYFHEFVRENSKEFFFSKHKHWEPESEIRLIHLGPKHYCNIENSISGIYLGYDFDNNLITLLRKLLPKNIWIEKVIIQDGRLLSTTILDYNYENY